MYSDTSCIDWIDERDFFYWVNMSGGSFYNNDWKINWLPYISSRWIVEKKASIPNNKSNDFCKNMIWENIQLWEKIIKVNNKTIKLSDIPRISFLKEKYDISKSIVDILEIEMWNFNS
jgi:hypothetical protein